MTKGTGADSNRVEMPNGTENFRNFQISRKKDKLERRTEIFEMNFRKISVPFDFKPEFSEILVEWNAPSNSLGDWYEQYLCRPRPRAVWVPHFKKVQGVLASFKGAVWRSRMALTGRGGTETDTRRGIVLLASVSEGVRRTTSLYLVSILPPGKYNFLFIPSTTDAHNTCAGYWYVKP